MLSNYRVNPMAGNVESDFTKYNEDEILSIYLFDMLFSPGIREDKIYD